MCDLKIIRNYAESLFFIAQRGAKEEKTLEQLSFFNEAIQTSFMMKEVLCSPIISNSHKTKLVAIVAKKFNFEKIVTQFFYILIKNARFVLLQSIIDAYVKLLAESKGIKSAVVLSAFKLKLKERNFIKKFLERELNKIIKINNIEDPSLIGGVVIKYDSNLIDCSILGALEKIKKIVKHAKVYK